MEETQKSSFISMRSTEPPQAAEVVTIDPETIFKAALAKLGSKEHKIQLKTTHDNEYFAILDVEINCSPYTENPKITTMYSYFYDTIKCAKEDVYSEAVAWLQSKLNLIIDIKTNQQLKETQHRLKMSATMASIIDEKYTRTTAEAARINSHKELAMTQMIATAEKTPRLLILTENTTPLKPSSTAYPHMVYMGQDPPTNEKEQLAECLCKVYTLLKLA